MPLGNEIYHPLFLGHVITFENEVKSSKEILSKTCQDNLTYEYLCRWIISKVYELGANNICVFCTKEYLSNRRIFSPRTCVNYLPHTKNSEGESHTFLPAFWFLEKQIHSFIHPCMRNCSALRLNTQISLIISTFAFISSSACIFISSKFLTRELGLYQIYSICRPRTI